SQLHITTTALAPTPTSSVRLQANLGAQEAAATVPFDLTTPDATSQYQTAVTVYDAVGQPHQMELYFTKTSNSPQQWDVNVTAPATAVERAPAGDRGVLATGSLIFTPDGSLASNSLGAGNVTWAGSAAASIEIDMGSTRG